jgi:shikimate kinase
VPLALGAIVDSRVPQVSGNAVGRQDQATRMIHLIGPGGAGKTIIGTELAERLDVRFVDLDVTSRHRDISAYLDEHGYAAYASLNVGLFVELEGGADRQGVVALSSGFMTYPDDIHVAYQACRQRVASSPSTFVLLPSLQLEPCVNETVRRQLGRPFSRSVEHEEQVIRARFPIYVGLPAWKIKTMQAVEAVVAELISALATQQAAAPDGIVAHSHAPLALDVS